jgi:hypothetical protein
MPNGSHILGFALSAVFAFNAAVPIFADGAVLDFRSALPARSQATPAAASDLRAAPGPAGPSEAQLRAAFPAGSLQRMDPEAFQAFVRTHAGMGRILDGMELAAVVEDRASSEPARSAAPPAPSRTVCDSLPSAARGRCLDSLSRHAAADTAGPRAEPRALREMRAKEAAARAARERETRGRDTSTHKANAINEEAAPDSQASMLQDPRQAAPDQDLTGAQAADNERTKGWFANLFLDFTDRGSKGSGMDGHDWAALIYVVIGVVVVGAFLIYAAQTLVELAVNADHDPLFQEAGLRLSYSGRSWRDGAGANLYRDAYLAGIRYAIGFDRPGADVGLAVEGGYIDIRLTPLDGPGDAFDFRGGYLVAGPLLRFGSFDPLCFSMEFLNGTSTHASIGWISKARMALQYRMGRHEVIGADLGAVFYDLAFLDGLALRRGDFNRDLSLIGGLDFGWVF